ncbi:fatty acid synthase-like [Pectinophora gossypiella]|uniref:fatty acid synthase-like n=1 Tax=Pectinophora gossypiella TaxID=13191 RepID=UPI00214F1AEF|nr:fatty acid synthase-like [Pectinophora gossypiella]XP_049878857.1 fatty acid synthase-like [Pectinophora gossypiella]
MAPTPQEPCAQEFSGAGGLDGERVVISGMSGLFPQSKHVQDLEKILYNKINPVTDSHKRWRFSHPEVRDHTGVVPSLDLFDGQFFMVHYRLGNSMDPMGRKLLEQAYQAIYDAGVNPEHLSGRKVGVYTGSCFSETEKACFYVASSRTGFGIAGCSKTMFANRISYWLNAKGPSMSIDDACCSSMAALEQAYLAISRGECEAAVVGGANLCLHPQSSVHCGRIMTLCQDGKTKSFDQNADGLAKSEAVNVLFLQKAKDAKRIYAEVLHVRSEFTSIVECETGPKFGFYRDPLSMVKFLKNFYKEAKIPPQAVEYVEAFGSAVPEADKSELEAIEEVFCKNRDNPLLVGSVMSNIGYGEAAAGISAITKVLLGYHIGELAGNLHCENPRRDIPAIRDGKMQIVTDHTRFGRSYTAINGISITGINAHVLLHGHYKPKDPNRYKSSIPHLVTISARQDTAVKNILDDLKSRPIDPEELALFHNIHQTRISGHLGRGYTILATNEEGQTVSLAETSNYFDDAKRPLWFVYSGMGSQWAGMGTELMRIPVFAAAIERCHKALEPKGVDIVHIITSPDKTIFDNILNSFVGIAAVQIGLTDVLTSLGIVPDKIIGHSVGELGCAYADGCFTAEEMILSAYSRGLVSVQTPFIRGSMAAVGIGYEKVVPLLPPEIEVACHNAPESSTISGPAGIMKEFVAQLTAQGIFAKEVPCSNIAYHSRYIAEAGPGLLKYLSEVIKNPKPRSDRWVSTSVPEDKWDEPTAKLSSAYYHTNNLLNPVLFEETSRLIPSNAVLVEIAPHGLLQAILKRSLPESCRNIALTRRGHADNTTLVLDAIGKLYMEGYNPKVQALYPQVQFPVSTGTPMLSHLVQWAHNEKWSLPLFVSAHRKMAASCKFIISTHDEESKYIQGNVIRGKTVYPYAASLVAVWDTLAMSMHMPRKAVSVEFGDVRLFACPVLHDRRPLRLSVALHRANGYFEVLDEDRIVAIGYIRGDVQESTRAFKMTFESEEELDVTSDDVYQMFYERDYFYSGECRSIHKTNKSLTEAQIVWNGNWVTYLDGLLQLSTLRNKHDTVSQPIAIKKINIDLKEHDKCMKLESEGVTVVPAHVFEVHNTYRCGGILMQNIQFRKLQLIGENPVDLKALKFVPRNQPTLDVASTLQVYLQIIAENINKENINVLGIINRGNEDLRVFDAIRNGLNDIPGITVQYEQMRRDQVLVKRDHFLTEVDLVLMQDLSTDDSLCQMLYRVLRRDSFLISSEDHTEDRVRPSALYRVVSTRSHKDIKLELVKWRPTQATAASTVVTVRNRSELSLLTATRSDLPQRHRLVILSSFPPVSGLKELVKQWRKEVDRNQIYVVMISDRDNLEQLPELDLAFNVLVNGVWGGEYYTSWQDKVTADKAVALRSSRVGDLESLHWVEVGAPTEPGIPVTVHYTAINDYDVKKATGVAQIRFEKETSYCMDFSGVTDKGDRVMGVIPTGAACSRVKARSNLLWPVPDHWSLEEAATVPSAYAQAFYCLGVKVQFRRGYKILVHGATGALGQATINVALAHGCEVFATVSDIRKKRFLMKLFPQIKEDHIGNSRDASFGDMVRNLTKDKGCNIVINCLRGQLRNVSMNCLSMCGILVDTIQIPHQEDYNFGLFYLTKERNYTPIDFASVLTENSKDLQKIQILISEGIARGYVKPLTRMTYAPEHVSRAFRLFAASRHRGRVLLRLQGKSTVAEPRLTCSPELCHVVICDENIFALQWTERLISRGARKVHLHCGHPSKNLQLKVQTWQSQGVKVQVSSEVLMNNKGIVSVLSESNRLGPVEGIYVIATDASEKSVDKISAVVANLDLAARKLCPSIRFFAVVNAGISVGQQTCGVRVRDGLPATVLNLPALRKPHDVNTTKETISWRSAVNATERAIRSSQSNLLAHPLTVPRPSLLQQIAAISDIEISEETAGNITLLDLGIEVAKVPAICSFLQDTHNVTLMEEKIPNLTIQNIRALEEIATGIKFEKVRGLKTFFTYVDPDELLATTEMVFLPTLTNSSTMREDEFNVNDTFLCIIPGMEGHHHRFQVLCERLKLPALVLQPGLDHLRETPRETAERYAKNLLKKACVRSNFYLLGYESGVLVALELAAILEDHGLIGTVFCLGGTPEEFLAILDEELSDIPNDEALQDAVIHHMYTLMTGSEEGLDKALENSSTWHEKVESCVRMLLGRVAHSAQYARSLLQAAYARLKQGQTYKLQPRELKSKLVLLHAANSHTDVSPAKLLQRYSQHSVTVHELCEPLAHCTRDLRCSAIINSSIDPELIKSFNERNICDTYLMNADTFMTVVTDADNIE